MIACRFNPFSLPLESFPAAELNRLREVSEGWYVDYKSQAVTARDFGKYLSSFANQYGGWLFVGVEEGPHKSLRAGSFPGIPDDEVGEVLVQIREGVSAHVSPFVYFDHRIIQGPVEEIALESGRSIIVVYVPEGVNPPFVHSTGKIYRRVGDSSEPRAETDRSVLDGMWKKSDQTTTALHEFILSPTRGVSPDRPICYIYLLSDPTLAGPEWPLQFGEFRDALQRQHEHAFQPTLENVYPTQDGYVARCLSTNDPYLELTGMRWWRNGNTRITIPLNFMEAPEAVTPDDIYREMLGQLKISFRGRNARLLDLDELLFVSVGLAMRYLDLRDHLQDRGSISAKIVITKARNCIPFTGMPSYLGTIAKSGIPVIPDELILTPVGTSFNSLRLLSDKCSDSVGERALSLLMPLMFDAIRALGIYATSDRETFTQEAIAALCSGSQRTQNRYLRVTGTR